MRAAWTPEQREAFNIRRRVLNPKTLGPRRMFTDAQRREKLKMKMRLFRSRHPYDHSTRIKYLAENADRIRRTQRQCTLIRRYGISVEEFDAMLWAQGNACAICRAPFTEKRRGGPCIDHDHGTGLVRDLLCLKCNSGIAMFDESPESLRRAIDYLIAHAARRTA
jgi:hypothetical protein